MLTAIRERVLTRPIKEIIGRYIISGSFWRKTTWGARSVDETLTDYSFFDKLRNGQVRGYELSGLLMAPISGILAAWVLGDGAQAEPVGEPDDDSLVYTKTLVNRFLTRIRGLLIRVLVDLYDLGDQYIIVNPDGSLSVPPPDCVEKVVDRLDYRRAEKYIVTTVMASATVKDEYRLDGRTITITNTGKDNLEFGGQTILPRAVATFEFENLIGRIPVVHLANRRGSNETHGRPEAAPLRMLLSRYNDLLVKALDGAETLSNPVPVFQGMENVDETIEANAEPVDDDWTDEDGTTRSRARIVWDRLAAIVIGKGGSFQFAGPARGFTEDIKGMLKVLFLIVLEFTRIPEVVWGGELGQARSSSVEQLKTFFAHITGKRLEVEGEGSDDMLMAEANGGLLELLDIWLKMRALTDRKVQVVPLALEWPELSDRGDEITLKWAQALYLIGAITRKKYLELSQRVKNAEAEVAAAQAETDAEREAEPDIDLPTLNEDDGAGDEDVPELEGAA